MNRKQSFLSTSLACHLDYKVASQIIEQVDISLHAKPLLFVFIV